MPGGEVRVTDKGMAAPAVPVFDPRLRVVCAQMLEEQIVKIRGSATNRNEFFIDIRSEVEDYHYPRTSTSWHSI